MKGLLRGIGYFLLYMVFTIVIQVALFIVIVLIAGGMGITGQAQIEDFWSGYSEKKVILIMI